MKAILQDATDNITVVLADGEAEEFTKKEFIETYGEDALPSKTSKQGIELHPTHYWNAALSLIKAWSEYQAKKKLYINVSHPETYHKVADIFRQYYHRDYSLLRGHRDQLSREVDEELAYFEDLCSGYGVEPVSREWLYSRLKESKDYSSLREKCKRRREKPAESLKNL